MDLSPIYNQWEHWSSTFHTPNIGQLWDIYRQSAWLCTVSFFFLLLFILFMISVVGLLSSLSSESRIGRNQLAKITIVVATVIVWVVGYLGLMFICPCNRTSSEPRPSETVLEYISRESGVKDLSCSYDRYQKTSKGEDSSEPTTEEKAMGVPPDYGYQFVKIPDGYYNCKATITNTTSKDVDPGASADVILNVRGNTATLTRTSNGEILKPQEPGLGD